MKNAFLILMGFLLFIVISCEKEPVTETPDPDPMVEPEECETEGVTYNGQIQEIFSGCTASSCHGASTGRSLANYDDAKAYAGNGRILGALRRESGFSAMPRNAAMLPACEIEQVAAWIEADFPEG